LPASDITAPVAQPSLGPADCLTDAERRHHPRRTRPPLMLPARRRSGQAGEKMQDIWTRPMIIDNIPR
jgi:hypothetical protein